MKFEHAALVLINVQKDFCAGGVLPVPDGDAVCPVINRLLPHFDFVAATQDWHPANHCSFKERGGPWLPHCLQKSRGAELHPAIDPFAIDVCLKKGEDPAREAYSAFDGRDERGRRFDECLKERDVQTLYVAGLTTDYGIRATVLDALQLGYKVYVVTDAIRAVNLQRKDGDRALKEMKKKGAHLRESKRLLK